MFNLSIVYADGRIDKITVASKEEAELHVDLNCNVFEDDIWVGAAGSAMVEWTERFHFGW